MTTDDHVIRGNRLAGNGFGRGQAAIVVAHGTGNRVEHNLLTGNWGGISVYHDAIQTVVRGNTLAGNRHNAVTVDTRARQTVVEGTQLTETAPPDVPPPPPLPAPQGLRVLRREPGEEVSRH
jgi:parallel beta-helix repeat protein